MTQEQAISLFLDALQPLQMHGFHLSLHGQTLAEGYWKPFSSHQPHRLFSVSKSVVSLAIGLLVTDGKVRLDDRICSFFPEWVSSDTSPLLLSTTIRDMLTMRTPFRSTTYRPLLDDNWARTWFSAEPHHIPGTVFNYDTSASQVLCALVEKLTGMPILSFMENRLFSKIGMNGHKQWLQDRSGTSQGGTGLIMTLRDFALLTAFFASDGMGLISPDYLKAAVSRQTDTPLRAGREERNGYGYQVWRTRDGFSLYGMGGQMGICMPGKGLVLCTLADTMKDEQGVQPIYDAFFEHLSHIDTYPASPEDRKALDLRLAALKLSCLPTCEEQVHPGVLHLINADPGLPFHTLSVHDHELVFEGEACWHLPFSDTAWIPGTFPQTDVPCYTHAAWTAPDTFCLHCELTGTWTGSMQLLMVIRDRTATLQVQSRIWELLPGWQGTAFGKWS